MRMLIIDDSSTMRRFLGVIAKELAIETEQAADGQEALERLERGSDFDVALVDWDMPRMNGLEFIQAVRTRPEFEGLKLMMLTSHNSIQDVRVALASGANDYLMKPVTQEMIAEKLTLLGLLSA